MKATDILLMLLKSIFQENGGKMEHEALSIVTITYNCWTYLDKCIRSINDSDFPVSEIIVVDNASVDGTAGKVRNKYPGIKLIENKENLGAIRGVNLGYNAVTGDRILLLDSDTELKPDTIRVMYEFMNEHPEVTMVVPRTLDSDGKVQETARKFPSVINGIFGRQSILTKLFPNNPFSGRYLLREHLDSKEPFQVEMASAACMMFRKSIFDSVGMVDEGYGRFVGYWNDADWCKRIQKSGGILYCLPNAIIVHHEQNKPFRKKSPSRIIEFHTGAYRFYRLHYTLGKWDPRSLIAALLLAARSLLLLALNTFKPSPETSVDPMLQKE